MTNDSFYMSTFPPFGNNLNHGEQHSVIFLLFCFVIQK